MSAQPVSGRPNLRVRIVVAFVVTVVILAAVLGLGLTAIANLHDESVRVAEARLPMVRALQELRFAHRHQRIELLEIVRVARPGLL